MGCRILEGKDSGAVFYCSTSDWAFGPLMNDYDEAESFLKWLKIDPRTLSENELEKKYVDFQTERSERYEALQDTVEDRANDYD